MTIYFVRIICFLAIACGASISIACTIDVENAAPISQNTDTTNTGSTTSSDETSSFLSFDFSSTNAYAIDFSNCKTLNLSISGIENSTLILVKYNTGSSTAYASTTGTAALTSITKSKVGSDDSSLTQKTNGISFPEGPIRRPHAAATASSETILKSTAVLPIGISRSTTTSGSTYIKYGESSSNYIEGSTSAQFWVDYSDSDGNLIGFDTVKATLKKITAHTYIWVAQANTTDNKKATSQFSISGLSTSAISLLGDAFEAIVFPGDTSIFGYECGGGSTGTGGIDANQHISILLYDIDFDNNASTSGYVAGYYWSKDETTASTVSTFTTDGTYPSNGREIFYLDAKALTDNPWTIVSTLAHEYQHMIHWNQVTNGSRMSVSTWQNEFQSLMAEELVSATLSTYSSNQSYLSNYYDYYIDGPGYWSKYFNKFYYKASLNTWNSSVFDYMYATVFGAYVLRAYGGIAYMKDYVSYLDTGNSAATSLALAAINASLRTPESVTNGTAIHPHAVTLLSSSTFFPSLQPGFIEALYGLGSEGKSDCSPFTRSDARAWNASSSGSLALFPYSIDTSIYSYAGTNYHPNGSFRPDYFPISSTVDIPPFGFTVHSAEEGLIDTSATSLMFTLTRPTLSTVKYLLLKLP